LSRRRFKEHTREYSDPSIVTFNASKNESIVYSCAVHPWTVPLSAIDLIAPKHSNPSTNKNKPSFKSSVPYFFSPVLETLNSMENVSFGISSASTCGWPADALIIAGSTSLHIVRYIGLYTTMNHFINAMHEMQTTAACQKSSKQIERKNIRIAVTDLLANVSENETLVGLCVAYEHDNKQSIPSLVLATIGADLKLSPPPNGGFVVSFLQ